MKTADGQGALGTTPPIYVPRLQDSTVVRHDEAYFVVRVHSAQSAFSGSVWGSFLFPVKRLLVTSQINLHRPEVSDQAILAVRHVPPVVRRKRTMLGLRTNLIDLVPAVMTHVSIDIEFVLDRKNRLKDLVRLINNDKLLVPLSLDPASAATARTIGAFADQLLTAFLGEREREAILKFTGAFNLKTNDLRDGFYVILGSQDKSAPLPSPLPTADKLQVTQNELLYGNRPVLHWSYIVLEVIHLHLRTRAKATGTGWDKLFRQAEDSAQQFSFTLRPGKTQRHNAMEQCIKLIIKGQTLLAADPNYLRTEAEAIVAEVQRKCEGYIFGITATANVQETGLDPTETFSVEPYRLALGLSTGKDFDELVASYSQRVQRVQELFKKHGI